MKWLVGLLATVALLLAGYAIYKTKKLESATEPRFHPIASSVVAR